MDGQTTYLSFWDVVLENLPIGTFRKRALSTDEARRLVTSARASKTLVCVSKHDLGAPYCARERAGHEELCMALRQHAGIEIHLEDFFGPDFANPLCFAEVTSRGHLLVVDCGYAFGAGPPSSAHTTGPEEALDVSEGRPQGTPMKMDVVPSSIQFYVFEQLDLELIRKLR